MKDRVHLFTKEEFVLLAACAGIHRMYGFETGADALKREGAIAALQKLHVRGCVETEDDRFRLCGETKDLFAGIREAATTLEVRKSNGRSCMIYIGSEAVRVAPSVRRQGMLEVQGIAVADLWDFLQDEGWIPKEQEERMEEIL